MANEKTAQIIRQLKEIRERRGLTYQNVLDMVEESGNYVSLSTVRRVFADGSEERDFKYNDSIRPIMIALVGADVVKPKEGEIMSIAEQEANALRTVAALKEDMIQELREENLRLKEEYGTRLSYTKEESEKKTKHIADLTKQIEKKDKIIFLLVFIVLALSLLIIIALIIDKINPDLGYFWRSMGAIISGNNPLKGGSETFDPSVFLSRIFEG